jgi:hypothetical protein
MDSSFAVEGKVPYRSKIVEVSVLFQSCFHIVPGSAQLLILHLQFDLVDLQLVKESLRLITIAGRIRFW